MHPVGQPARPVARTPAARAFAWIRWFGILRFISGAIGLLVLGAVGLWAVRAPSPGAALPDPADRSGVSRPGGTPSADAGAAPTGAPGVPSVTLVGRPPLEVPISVVVHVAGAVTRPGVHTLDAGARVVDAVAAAGGPLADAELDALNLAATVADGQRIYVPLVGEVVIGPDSVASVGPPVPVDVNRASVTELEALPGVGPAIAAEIVAERERRGPYTSVDDLLRVRGIGPAKLAALRDLATTS